MSVDAGTTRLGHDLSAALGVEAIDHHPVEAGEGAQLAGALAIEAGDGLAGVEPRDHSPDQGGDLEMVVVSGFGLDHHRAP